MKVMDARFLIGCLVLAAAVAMVVPAPASAAAGGVAFQASSLPVQVRGEGLTETIGAVVLQATSSGTVVSGSSITVVYSGAITNATSFGGTTPQAGLSCVIGGIACAPVPTTISIAASGSQATISFSASIALSAGDYIELSQVRMNVNALGSAASTVTATLSGTSGSPIANPITFTQSQVGVASIVTPSLKAKIASTAAPIQTCSVAAGTFSLNVSEAYPAALTSLTDEQAFSGLGTVSNGSLINVTINNLPTGFGVGYAGAVPITGSSIALTQTAPTSAITISTGSAITYTFSVNNGTDSTSVIDGTVLTFNIGYTNGKSTPALSGTTAPALGTVVTATATVSLGPSSGIVSFATNNQATGTIASLGDCVTNLLFPFTTNQVGFDTNIQISNTSADKLAFPSGGASAQAGTCTLTYYPTDLTTQTASASGAAGTPSQFTTPSIPAGGAYSFAQSTSTFKNQSGYMFAVCRFLDAHGFSYVVNGTPTTGTISQGLLALVIPNSSIGACGSGAPTDCGRLANPGNPGVPYPVPGGNYEGLGH